jgi:mannose-6-phosphate isomerase-like protein (cupin superfamily)
MRYLKPFASIALFTLALIPALTANGQGQRGETLAWAPVPVKPGVWVAPHKPHTKLSELLAAHNGQPSWKETIVDDDLLHAEYIQMAPGTKTPRRFHPDNRAWWIVQDGQVRFNVEEQEPFVASKGFLVQVPYRNVYSMEVVGDKPALFFEVTIANAQTMYPIDETPEPRPGFQFVRVRVTGKDRYDDLNKPYFEFNAMVASGIMRQTRFIADDRAVANIIRGNPQRENPKDKGHFHEVSPEFWFILEGQISYRIGDMPVFLADQGDIVYVPKQTWHRALHAVTWT